MSALLLGPLLAQVGSGRITGGWSYVYLSYGVTLFTLIAYSVSLFLRHRALEQESSKDPQP